jgi:hypothetical protein
MNLIKITRQSLPIMFAIMLGGRNFLDYPAFAQVQIDTLLSQIPPKEPRTERPSRTTLAEEPHRTYPSRPVLEGLPDNQTKPGGGLVPSKPSCKSTSKPLTALIPVKNPVLTTREHPTFLFYVPDASDDVRFGEFSLFVVGPERTPLYKTRFTLPQTPGIASITLPSKPEYALEEGKFYHWYFELYCQTNTSSQPNLDVNGWVQRVALTRKRERQINAATPDVWYDSSANLAESLRASPQDAKLRNDWLNLLKSIGSEDLAQEQLVGSVVPFQYLAVPRRRQQQVVPSLQETTTPRTFADWCLNKANLSGETLHTVDALLQVAKTQDCNQADKLLSTRTSLSLRNNKIADLKPLSTLTNLTELSLGSNQIADLKPLSTLTNLTELSLDSNQIADLKPLSTLTNLTNLTLYDNQIADLKPLSALTNLTYLHLYSNQIADLKPLSTLTNLIILYLSDNQIADLRPLSTPPT